MGGRGRASEGGKSDRLTSGVPQLMGILGRL